MNDKQLALSDIKQRVTDTIKARFAELIPDDEWAALIDQQVKLFLEQDLPDIVKDELRQEFKHMAKAKLAKLEWQEQWTNDGTIASEAVTRLVQENADTIFASFVSNMVQACVNQMRQQTY